MKKPNRIALRSSLLISARASRGFTLMELLVVVAIIVILAALSLGGWALLSANSAREMQITDQNAGDRFGRI